MPKRSNEFQRLIFAIQNTIDNDAVVTESKELTDRETGSEKVEVDVVIETEAHGFPVVISLEVRERKRKCDVGWVREMLGKHLKLPTDILVLVSSSGFTREAIKKAKANNIEPITFEDAKLFGWSTKIKELISSKGLYLGSFNMIPLKLEFAFAEGVGDDAASTIASNDIFHSPSLSKSAALDEIANAILRMDEVAVPIMERWVKEEKDTFTITLTPPPGSYIENKYGAKLPIKNFTLHGKCEVERVPVQFRHGTMQNMQVAHATVPNIFNGKKGSGKVTLSLVEQESKEMKGVIVIPGNKKEGAKVSRMRTPKK